jgi:hypothetical protein
MPPEVKHDVVASLAREAVRQSGASSTGPINRSRSRISQSSRIRDLTAHNKALLCMFLCKILLQDSEVPCNQWLAQQYLKDCIPHNCRAIETATWIFFASLVPLVQQSRQCKLGTRHKISFWIDHWTDLGRLYLSIRFYRHLQRHIRFFHFFAHHTNSDAEQNVQLLPFV